MAGVADGRWAEAVGGDVLRGAWVLLPRQLSLYLFRLQSFPWQSHGRCVHVSQPEALWLMGPLSGSAVESPLASARDVASVPGWGRCPGGGHGTPSSVLGWRIPRTEEPGGPQSMGSQGVGHD